VIDIVQHILKSVGRCCKDLKSDFDKTARHCSEAELFQNERELRDGCRREVASAVELHASLIDLYVAGINTAGTMMLIQKAKLGRDIDFLQSEGIDDDEKRATSEKLIQEIFGEEHQKLLSIEQRCRLIPQEMKSLSGEVSALGAQSDAVAAEVAAGKVGMSHDAASSIWDEALRPLVAEYETWQERECERLIATMVAKHHEIAKQFEQHKNGVISGWKKRLLWTGVLGMVIITGTLAVYYRFGMTSEQQSLSEVIVWGAAGNAVWAFAVFLFERISASRTEWVATSRSVFFRSAAPTITREMLLWALTPELAPVV
jgi:hypothetical protein